MKNDQQNFPAKAEIAQGIEIPYALAHRTLVNRATQIKPFCVVLFYHCASLTED